jgi:hypothetical protein
MQILKILSCTQWVICEKQWKGLSLCKHGGFSDSLPFLVTVGLVKSRHRWINLPTMDDCMHNMLTLQGTMGRKSLIAVRLVGSAL